MVSITSRTKTAPQHAARWECLGQVRGRAAASAAIRFELVVHVQAPDRREAGGGGGGSESQQLAAGSMCSRRGEQQRAACNIHAEGMSEWKSLGRVITSPACPSLRRAWD